MAQARQCLPEEYLLEMGRLLMRRERSLIEKNLSNSSPGSFRASGAKRAMMSRAASTSPSFTIQCTVKTHFC
jgi:hypothetical protein